MENILEAVILGGGAEDEVEFVILNNILVDRDDVGEPENSTFYLDNFSDQEIKLNFRFNRHDIEILTNTLRLPPEIQTDTRHKVNSNS